MNTSDKGAMSYSEGDYRQFEELTGIPEERVKVYEQHYKGESSEPQEKEPDLFYGYLEEGVYGEFRHVPEPSPNKNKIGFIFGGKRYEFTTRPAPVESQEELWKAVMFVINLCKEKECDPVISLSGIFSITRLTP